MISTTRHTVSAAAGTVSYIWLLMLLTATWIENKDLMASLVASWAAARSVRLVSISWTHLVMFPRLCHPIHYQLSHSFIFNFNGSTSASFKEPSTVLIIPLHRTLSCSSLALFFSVSQVNMQRHRCLYTYAPCNAVSFSIRRFIRTHSSYIHMCDYCMSYSSRFTYVS